MCIRDRHNVLPLNWRHKRFGQGVEQKVLLLVARMFHCMNFLQFFAVSYTHLDVYKRQIQSSVGSVGGLVLQNFMNGFGTQTVAAVTTAYRVDSIVMVPIINFGSGISTLAAQKFGSGDRKQARRIFSVGTLIMAGVSLLLTALVIPTGGQLIALFGAGQEAVAIGQGFFQRIASFYLIFGLATAVRSYLEGIGDVTYSSFAGILSLLCRIVLSYALVSIFANMVIAYAEAFSWVLLLALYLARFCWKEWRLKGQSKRSLSN